jgi:hypothetical protein
MQGIRAVVVVLVIILLYGSRLTKGKARETPEGLVFGMKPFVIFSRALALLVYAGYFLYSMQTSRFALPAWFPVVILLAIGFSMLQLPGTIVLGPTAISQRFWMLGTKVIRYEEVMSIQAFSAGRAIRVVGDNRVIITHTNNQSAAEEFKAEIARRTGKRVS